MKKLVTFFRIPVEIMFDVHVKIVESSSIVISDISVI